MRVIHFVVTYAPEIGGMENAVEELAERTARMGHDVTVITSSFKGSKKTERKDHLTIHRLWSIRRHGRPLIIPLLPVKLFTLIKRDTILHVHYIFRYFMDIVILIAKMKRCRIITHVHIDPPPSSPLGFLNPLYKKLIWKNVLSLSDVVICPTQDYVDIARHYEMPRSKCIVVPSGIDKTRFRRKDSSDISTPVRVLFVGRLSKQKNIPRLLEAFKLFQRKYEAVLHIVGEGEERNIVENIIKK